MTNTFSSRRLRLFTFLLTGLVLFAPLQVYACGKERWSVKTVTDKDAAKVQESPTPATINQLRQIPAPINPNIRSTSRYSPVELTTYEVTGWITVIKSEQDQDYHIVLADDKGLTMIVESAHPDCAQKSRFENDITQVRAAIDQAFGGAVHKKIQTRRLATITGVGFFDRIHGQEGVAPNGIELHPILHVVFHGHKSMGQLKKAVRAKREDEE